MGDEPREQVPAIDIRGFPIEVRETTSVQGDELPKVITGRVLTYGTVDEYGTRWSPGCFRGSLNKRLPPILWAHNPELPIGRTRSFKDGKDGLVLTFELDDPEYVPMARQAAWQIKNRTIDEFSVGFVRREARNLDPAKHDGAWEDMRVADMLESSCVPFGAVSGTAVVGMRALYLANGVRMYVPDRERIELSANNPRSDGSGNHSHGINPAAGTHSHGRMTDPGTNVSGENVSVSKPEGDGDSSKQTTNPSGGSTGATPSPDTSTTATGGTNPEGTNPQGTNLGENPAGDESNTGDGDNGNGNGNNNGNGNGNGESANGETNDDGTRIVTVTEDEINRENDPVTSRIKDNSTMVIRDDGGKRKMVRVAQEPELQSGIVRDRRAARIAAKKAEEAREAAKQEEKRKAEAREATSESANSALATLRKHRR